MIQYDAGNWGLTFILGCRGSVFPKAVVVSLPNAILAGVLHYFLHPDSDDQEDHQMVGFDVLWSGYSVVLGFLVVFRNNQAYSRFWEGSTLINQVRGEWFNAISSLFAFCNRKDEMKPRVQEFQQLLVRLSSMMYCAALQQVCDFDDHNLEILDIKGLSQESLDFLQDANDRCEVLLQWVQRLIVESASSQVLDIPPPILSRAFQELSRGIVNLNNVRKIRDIPFPYPYAQMITTMLLVHWVVTPLLAAFVVETMWWSCIVCFCVTAAFWSLKFIVLEIDMPFGSDPNDLPVGFMQQDFNKSLLDLLEPVAQSPPKFRFDPKRPFPDVVDSKGALTRSERPIFDRAFTGMSIVGSATSSPNRLTRQGSRRLSKRRTAQSTLSSLDEVERHPTMPPGVPEALYVRNSDAVLSSQAKRSHNSATQDDGYNSAAFSLVDSYRTFSGSISSALECHTQSSTHSFHRQQAGTDESQSSPTSFGTKCNEKMTVERLTVSSNCINEHTPPHGQLLPPSNSGRQPLAT